VALPWRKLIRYAPEILELSRQLIRKSQARESRKTEHGDLADQVQDLSARIARIEDGEKIQAELARKMAEQANALTDGLRLVAFRSLVALGASTAALVLSVVLLALLLR
jgi:hypothetical protein